MGLIGGKDGNLAMSEDSKVMLSVVVPVYNEEDAIGEVVEGIRQHKIHLLEEIPKLSSMEVLFVDDGSGDASKQIITEAIKEDHAFKVISHPTNLGYGAALQTGFNNARGEVIAFFDGDNTFRFENLKVLLKELFQDNLEMVSGCRFTNISKMPLIRMIGNKFFSLVIYFLTNEKVLDPGSGIRVLKKKVLDHKLLPLPLGLSFIIVMTTKALFESVKYREVQIAYDERVGTSKLSVVKDGFRFLGSILSVVSLNNPFKMYFLYTIMAMILAVIFACPIFVELKKSNSFPDVSWGIATSFFLNVSMLNYHLGVAVLSINRHIFGRTVRPSIIGRYLGSDRLHSKFWIISIMFLTIAFITYGVVKMGLLPTHWLTFIVICTFGFNGYLFAASYFIIQHIKKAYAQLQRKDIVVQQNQILG